MTILGCKMDWEQEFNIGLELSIWVLDDVKWERDEHDVLGLFKMDGCEQKINIWVLNISFYLSHTRINVYVCLIVYVYEMALEMGKNVETSTPRLKNSRQLKKPWQSIMEVNIHKSIVTIVRFLFYFFILSLSLSLSLSPPTIQFLLQILLCMREKFQRNNIHKRSRYLA